MLDMERRFSRFLLSSFVPSTTDVSLLFRTVALMPALSIPVMTGRISGQRTFRSPPELNRSKNPKWSKGRSRSN